MVYYEQMNEENMQQLCHKYLTGSTLHGLAKEYHTSYARVKEILISRNVKIRKQGMKVFLINGEPISEHRKRCPKCETVKDKSEFHANQVHCIVCRREIVREDKKRRYREDAEYRDRMKRYRKELRCKNKEKNKERNKAWRKQYYAKNREKLLNDARVRRLKNIEQERAKTANYIRNRKQTNLGFKMKSVLRCRIYNAIKASSGYKSARTKELLGCDMPFFMTYIENRFRPGMTWENYGQYGWHIDHIRPCASFDLTDPEQQKACFHYTNLQPLWATTDIAKSMGDVNCIGNINKRDHLIES